MSWFSYKLVTLKAHISPIFLGDIEEGIRIQLRTRLFRWVRELEGVFLGWKDIRILSSSAGVHGDTLPLIEVPVAVKALVWCPEKGGIMRGVMVHRGTDFIAARVLGLWNAVIVRNQYGQFDKEKAKDGVTVQFRIHNLQIINNLLSIEGSLLGEDVGLIDEEGNLHYPKVAHAPLDAPPVVQNSKKRKREDEGSPQPTHSANQENSSVVSTPIEASKKKRPKLKEIEEAEAQEASKKEKKDKADKHSKHHEKKEKHKDKQHKEKSKHKTKSE